MGQNGVLKGGGGFHHVAIRAYDFEATVKFYEEGLGFKERIRWGEGDGRAILLDTGDGNYMEVFAGGKEEANQEGAILHIAFRTTDIAAATEAAKAAGAVVTVEPKDVVVSNNPPTPIRISFVKAPNGEIIEFFQSTGDNQL